MSDSAAQENAGVGLPDLDDDPGLDGEVAVSVRQVQKIYRTGSGDEIPVLRGIDLDVEHGEAVSIVGASGVGKSTLLHILGGLDTATSGAVAVGGWRLDRLDEKALAELRNREIGFVFQFHHLLREFTALENVMMPQLIAGQTPDEARDRAHDLLTAVGLAHRVGHEPRQLSGGEQQRVAVARALANEPRLLLADEPTGNLDAHNSEQLHAILFDLREKHRLAMVLVTHSQELARKTDRILLLRDGVLQEDAGFDVVSQEWSTSTGPSDEV